MTTIHIARPSIVADPIRIPLSANTPDITILAEARNTGVLRPQIPRLASGDAHEAIRTVEETLCRTCSVAAFVLNVDALSNLEGLTDDRRTGALKTGIALTTRCDAFTPVGEACDDLTTI